MNARPTRQEPLACHAMSNAFRSRLRLSSSLSASCRLLAAAPAPGPSWDNLFSRQRAFARTMVTLIARRISPAAISRNSERKNYQRCNWRNSMCIIYNAYHSCMVKPSLQYFTNIYANGEPFLFHLARSLTKSLLIIYRHKH